MVILLEVCDPASGLRVRLASSSKLCSFACANPDLDSAKYHKCEKEVLFIQRRA